MIWRVMIFFLLSASLAYNNTRLGVQLKSITGTDLEEQNREIIPAPEKSDYVIVRALMTVLLALVLAKILSVSGDVVVIDPAFHDAHYCFQDFSRMLRIQVLPKEFA